MDEQHSEVLKKINIKLDTIVSKLDNLAEWRAVHTSIHETIGRDLTEVRTEVYGNQGDSFGLKSKVQTLLNCKEDINKWTGFWMYILQAIIIAGVLGVVVWLLNVYSSTNVK